VTTRITSSDAAKADTLAEPAQLNDYQRRVTAALGKSFEREQAEQEIDLRTSRIVVFSDHHKGSRDGADDFRGCERAYAAALAHYLEDGYRLIVLGDVEELWECSPKEVVAAYEDVLKLESEFHSAGRYDRFFGNHDLQWSERGEVETHLRKFFPGLDVRESLKLRVVDNGNRLGLLFLTHGHQGTLDSDRWAWLSKPFVRHVWRPLQIRLNMRSTVPSRDFQLRQRHDEAMFTWARNHAAKPILIAGHTHRPVFWVSTPPVKESAEELARELAAARASDKPDREKLAKLHARLEFVRAERRENGPPPIAIDPPVYFNTGCCSFGDGDVTGIEIADGEIRLVRWPDDDDQPLPKVLVTAHLDEVLDRVASAGRATGV
jgi:hypothetical protein